MVVWPCAAFLQLTCADQHIMAQHAGPNMCWDSPLFAAPAGVSAMAEPAWTERFSHGGTVQQRLLVRDKDANYIDNKVEAFYPHASTDRLQRVHGLLETRPGNNMSRGGHMQLVAPQQAHMIVSMLHLSRHWSLS